MPADNLMFMKGTQTNFNKISSYVNGTFYLTTDTNRLYIGGSDNAAHLLNQTVRIVPNLAALTSTTAEKNDFAYIQAGNILAVYTQDTADSQYKWIQINSQNHDNDIKAASVILTTESNIANAKVRLTKTDDTQIDSATIKFVGQDNIAITVNNDQIVVTGQRLTKSVANNTLNLTLGSDTVALSAPTGSNITITNTTAGAAISAKDTTNQSLSASVNTSGNLSVTVTDSDSNTVTGTVNGVGLKLKDSSGSDVIVPVQTTGTSDVYAPIYSKSEIDAKLNGLDGMTFKGGVSSSATLAAAQVKVGDVYLISSSSFTINNSLLANPSDAPTSYVVGDMLVATLKEGATEGANGYIASADVRWTYIPSGNDSLASVTYTPTIVTNTDEKSLEFKDGNENQVAKIGLIGGQDINLTTTNSTNKVLSVTVNHDTITTTTPAATTASSKSTFTAITGLTISNGHVTNIAKQEFSPNEYTLTKTITAANTTGNFKITLTDSSSNVQEAELPLKSDTLQFTVSQVNSKDTMNVNMVWGSFDT